MIEGRDLRQQIREAHRSVRESFEALLTPEQLEKLPEFLD